MHRGDVVLTPSWEFHDHGHDGAGPMVWLDGLDLPVYQFFPANFAQPYAEDRFPSQPAPDDTHLRYPWDEMQARLEAEPGPYCLRRLRAQTHRRSALARDRRRGRTARAQNTVVPATARNRRRRVPCVRGQRFDRRRRDEVALEERRHVLRPGLGAVSPRSRDQDVLVPLRRPSGARSDRRVSSRAFRLVSTGATPSRESLPYPDADLRAHPPRNPREQLAGLVFVPRTVDKVRAKLQGTLGFYKVGPGLSSRLFEWIGITEEDFTQAVRDAKSDDDIAEYIRTHCDTTTVRGDQPAPDRTRHPRRRAVRRSATALSRLTRLSATAQLVRDPRNGRPLVIRPRQRRKSQTHCRKLTVSRCGRQFGRRVRCQKLQ